MKNSLLRCCVLSIALETLNLIKGSAQEDAESLHGIGANKSAENY